MTEIVVTQAKRSDAKRIARLLDEWIATSAVPWPPSQPRAMDEWVLHTIDTGYVAIAESDGRLLGTAGIQLCYLPWNVDQPMAEDAFFYVPRARARSDGLSNDRVERAARRVPGVADALMTAIKLYCAKRNLPLLMQIISGSDTDKLERWYGIKGGRYIGGTMLFGLGGIANVSR